MTEKGALMIVLLSACVVSGNIKLLARKSCHCVIFPTTFIKVSIVLLVGIARAQIQYSKP